MNLFFLVLIPKYDQSAAKTLLVILVIYVIYPLMLTPSSWLGIILFFITCWYIFSYLQDGSWDMVIFLLKRRGSAHIQSPFSELGYLLISSCSKIIYFKFCSPNHLLSPKQWVDLQIFSSAFGFAVSFEFFN